MSCFCPPGDAYRYTLQPIFLNPTHDFRCHVRHRPPEVLYQLWFYISIAGTAFETPRLHTVVRPSDVHGDLRAGRHQMKFISVEHNAGLDVRPEMILTGQETPIPAAPWEYRVTPSGDDDDDDDDRSSEERTPVNAVLSANERLFPVNAISNNVFVLSTQFDRPFAYSTSTWVNGNNCNKNVTRFRPPPPKGRAPSNSSQPVHAVVRNEVTPYEYMLKSVRDPPHMKFLIPGDYNVWRASAAVVIGIM